MRLTDLIPSTDELRPRSDLNYIMIRRETESDQRIRVLSADLEAALAAPGSEADIELYRRDQATVFDLSKFSPCRQP